MQGRLVEASMPFDNARSGAGDFPVVFYEGSVGCVSNALRLNSQCSGIANASVTLAINHP